MLIGCGRLKREIAILKKCRHPNVVRLREVIDSPASKKIFMGEFRKRGNAGVELTSV